MNENTPALDEVRLTLRLPRHVAERIKQLAAMHERSLNGEIVYALRQYGQQERAPREEEATDGTREGQ